MKKLLASIFAAMLIMFGTASAASAAPSGDLPSQEELEEICAESDDVPPEFELLCQEIAENGGVYPIELPEEGTVPTTTPGPLPSTGSDATGSILYVGGILLAGGIVVMVIARRRSTAPAA